MPNIIQTPNAQLHLIYGPYAMGMVPDSKQFGYVNNRNLETHGTGTYWSKGLAAITDEYQGATGQFSVSSVDGRRVTDAVTHGIPPAAYMTHDPVLAKTFYIVGIAFDEDRATPLESYLVLGAKTQGDPKNMFSGDLQYSFTAKLALSFAKHELVIETFEGASSPVTALTFTKGEAANSHPDAAYDNAKERYALLVLTQKADSPGVKVLEPGTDYTETKGAVTLTTGIGEDEKALVVYAKKPGS